MVGDIDTYFWESHINWRLEPELVIPTLMHSVDSRSGSSCKKSAGKLQTWKRPD